MIHGALQQRLAWAEDRALQRCGHRPKGGPSAVPGVGVKTGPNDLRSGRFHPSHQHQSAKPVWQDVRLHTAGRPPSLANADQPEFQFTVNQDTSIRGKCKLCGWSELAFERLIAGFCGN
jgi:hypothetical protein